MPLVTLTAIPRKRASRAVTSRRNFEGTATTTHALPAAASSKSGSYFSCGGNGMPGKKISLRPVRCTSRR